MLVHSREENVNRIDSTFETPAEPSVPFTVTTLDAAQSLRSVFFLNETTGWIGGTGGLYFTTDGGGHWERSGLEMPGEGAVHKVFFANSQLGWAVTESHPANDDDPYFHTHFWVNRTTDGGKIWQVQLDLINSAINSIRFLNNDEGWITGSTLTDDRASPWHHFILHTSDQGEHWVDISAGLKQSLADYGKDNYFRRGFTDVLPEGPLAATVLLPEGRMYRTTDNGQNWQTVSGRVVPDVGYLYSHQVGGNDDDLWIAGYTRGHWSTAMFAIRKGNVWTEYGMSGIGFSAVAVLPGDRIVAGGSLDVSENPNFAEKIRAVLSYSADGGKKWEILYKDSQAEAINAVTAVERNDVWAVGDKGLILHVTPQAVMAKR